MLKFDVVPFNICVCLAYFVETGNDVSIISYLVAFLSVFPDEKSRGKQTGSTNPASMGIYRGYKADISTKGNDNTLEGVATDMYVCLHECLGHGRDFSGICVIQLKHQVDSLADL